MATSRSRRTRIIHRIRISFQCRTVAQRAIFYEIWGGRFVMVGILTVIIGFSIAIGGFTEQNYIGYIAIASGGTMCIFGYISASKGRSMRTLNHIAPSLQTVSGTAVPDIPPPYNPQWSAARTAETTLSNLNIQDNYSTIVPPPATYNSRPPSAAPPTYEEAIIFSSS